MATFKYKLKNKNIYIDFSYSRGIRLKQSTYTQVVNPKNWVAKDQKVRINNEEKNARGINQKLNKIRTEFETGVYKLEEDLGSIPDTSYLKELVLVVLGKKEKEEVKKETLLEIAKRYATASNLRSDSSGDSIKDSTQSGYKTFYHKLLEYQKDRRIKLDYKSIDRKFYLDFVSYWEEKGYKPNTIGSYIKRLKSLMNAAEELGFHNNREYTKPYFKKFTESVDNVYMTEEELIAISKLELEFDSILDRARDWFLIGCKTGLRISDLKALGKSNISQLGEKRYINIRNQKTKNKVSIPISSLLNDILAKRDYHFPKFMSDQKFNDYIKEVGRLAGIDSECEIKQHKNTKHDLDMGPKYLMMSSHTGRRTFCTNAYLAGISESWIMQISGHTSYNSFKEYIKADHLERAILLADHPFFG